MEGRKTVFTAVVEATKGFLSAEERDEMAKVIRPEYPLAPLPPVTTALTPVVTRARERPLEVTPQPSTTPVVTSASLVTAAMVVTTAVVITTTTNTVPVTTTVITPVTVTATNMPVTAETNNMAVSVAVSVPISIMPQVGVTVVSQQPVLPVGGTATKMNLWW